MNQMRVETMEMNVENRSYQLCDMAKRGNIVEEYEMNDALIQCSVMSGEKDCWNIIDREHEIDVQGYSKEGKGRLHLMNALDALKDGAPVFWNMKVDVVGDDKYRWQLMCEDGVISGKQEYTTKGSARRAGKKAMLDYNRVG